MEISVLAPRLLVFGAAALGLWWRGPDGRWAKRSFGLSLPQGRAGLPQGPRERAVGDVLGGIENHGPDLYLERGPKQVER